MKSNSFPETFIFKSLLLVPAIIQLVLIFLFGDRAVQEILDTPYPERIAPFCGSIGNIVMFIVAFWSLTVVASVKIVDGKIFIWTLGKWSQLDVKKIESIKAGNNYIDLVVPGANLFKRYRIPFTFDRENQGIIYNEIDYLKSRTQ
jgi:hypothetical protein